MYFRYILILCVFYGVHVGVSYCCYCRVKHVNWFCFCGSAGSLVRDSILCFPFNSLFPCMQSCFIPINYCSNILIIPGLLVCWFFCVSVSSAGVSRRPLQSADGELVFLSLSCSVRLVNPVSACLVCRVASLNGFIYTFVIHYSWNQKRPSWCKQSACLRFLVLRTKKKQRWRAASGSAFPWEGFSLSDRFTGFRRTLRLLVSMWKPDVMWSAFRSRIRCSFIFILRPTLDGGDAPCRETRRSWFVFFLGMHRCSS